MIEFWSIWNFSWWGLSQLKIVKLNYSLAGSIIATSAIGGFMIHIYPRKLKINYNNERIIIPYKYAIWIDIFGHHLPLYMLYKQRNQIEKSCGRFLIIPAIGYSLTNYLRNTPLIKTYGINGKHLYLTSFTIVSSLGGLYHFNKNRRI
jgi:hypothetical protein